MGYQKIYFFDVFRTSWPIWCQVGSREWKKVLRGANKPRFWGLDALKHSIGSAFQHGKNAGVSSPGLGGKSYGGSPLTCPGRKEWLPGVGAMIHYFYNFEAWKMMPENGEIGVPKWLQKVKEIRKSRLLHALGRGSET